MSSLRKSAPRRSHSERSQLASRAHLGLLEKHSDYVLRAQDFHKKTKAIDNLKRKASFKNPDEFYFGMVKAKLKKGVHVRESRNEQFDHEALQLLKTQDQNYITYQRTLNLHVVNHKKAERMQADIHTGSGSNHHLVFVESKENVKEFDPCVHFDTLPELVGNKTNRMRISTLETVELPQVDETNEMLLQMEKEAFDKELSGRLARDASLRTVEQELHLQKQLMGKGARRKTGLDSRGNPVYKWRNQRSK